MPLMAGSTPLTRHPVRVFEARVAEVRNLSPHFRRITFTGPSLRAFGVPGPTLDLRIKMLLPTPGHALRPPGTPNGYLRPGWYQDWLRQEQPGRGFIRSYTVRALRRTGPDAEIDVDFVLREGPRSHSGPGSSWAREVSAGRRAWFVGPDATAHTDATPLPESGINWNPRGARHVLLAGDETAVPAISSILETLPTDITGHAFLEVPEPADILPLTTGSGVQVVWLHRGGGTVPRGLRLRAAVEQAIIAPGREPFEYAWVGAEAGSVKDLRRYLAGSGLNPRTSEFRGYWSMGKSGSGTNGIPVPSGLEPRGD
ncbi:SIP domain-containing protein [Arthrobacter sp.]|uniref:siderophore-interacting protein n=1 Tax=Arthrobacter sp. TaxID=1667 RepID=UPI00339680EE